jgi:outer membrane immunogenic protein
MKKLAITITAIALIGTPAFAADMAVKAPPPPAPPPVPFYNWAGWYLGGNVGGAWMRASEQFINNANVLDPLSFNPSSVIGGGQLGIQGQWGNWVLGAEGTFSFTDLNQTDQSIFPGPPRTRSLRVDDIATVTAKGGYAANNWMVYVKGGWADIRLNPSSFNPLTGHTSGGAKWYGGWTIGTGVDYLFARNWIAGLEFDYYTATFNHNFVFSDGTPGSITGSRANIYAVTGRLSYLFDWPR